MKILALELATEACSVAVQSGGNILSRHSIAPRQHAELALPWSDVLLRDSGLTKNDLDAIAISVGPGAFTGVRLAIAMGQGMSLALGIPLLGVSTLAVLAMEATRDGFTGNILAVIDARMGEIYGARFAWDGQSLVPISDEVVVAPSLLDIDGIDTTWRAVGTGVDAADRFLRTRLPCELVPDALPHAEMLVRLAREVEPIAPERVEPTYLRNNVALTLAEQRAAREAKAAPKSN